MSYYVIAAWFLAILFGTANVIRLVHRNDIPAINVIVFSTGVVGLVVHYIGH